MAPAVLHDLAAMTTGVEDRRVRLARFAVNNEPDHLRHAAMMSVGGQRGPSATGSTPALRKRGATITGPRRTAPAAMGIPEGRDSNVATIAIPVVATLSDRSAATTTSADHEPDLHPAAQRERATTVRADEGEDRRVRRGVMTIGGQRGRVPRRVSNVETGRRVRRAVDRGRDRADLDAVRVAVRVARSVDLVADPAARGVARTLAQVGRRVVHVRDRDRVGRDNGHSNDVTIRQVEREVAVTDRRMTIAIDGPAAAGKSTVGEIVAQRIDGVYFDSGLLYRALTLLAIEYGVDPSDAERLAELATSMDIRVGRPSIEDGRQVDVWLAGRDLTHLLRTPEVDRNVSAVSAHAPVRTALLEQQRRIGRSGRVVMVGRDIGTVVLPDAELKVFLDASAEERARRRCRQLDEMGNPLPYDVILADMRRRDQIDSERDVAPLRPADDAVVIDSDASTVDEVADLIVRHVESRLNAVRG